MNIAVRYLSKSGRTESIAKAIAKGADTTAVSVSEQKSLDEKYDILFLGGAPYANFMDPELRKYIEQIEAENVGLAVLFTTSNWSMRTLRSMRKMLKAKGIKVADETFFAQALMIESKQADAEKFAQQILNKYSK